MSFKGKVALVTGGSQGIGEAVSKALGAQGVHVAVVASRSLDKASAVAEQIRHDGGSAGAYACDVRDASKVGAIVDNVLTDVGPIDFLVNAAGVFFPTPAGETPVEKLDSLIDTNLKGTWNLVNAVVPGMKSRQQGRIVNFASVAGVCGIGSYALYCATKAGIIMMSRALACELGRLGITVNCIAPGNTETPINADIRTDPALKDVLEFMRTRTPSTRVYSQPEDIAAGVLFMLSDAGKAMNGSCLLMDEGISAGL